jgi:hypothetical protein
MARFNEILVGRFNRFAQKYFSMKGGPVAAQLASEIGLTHEFFNGIENRSLEGWNNFWGVFPVAAFATGVGAIRFRNPKVSNVIAIFEALSFYTLVGNDQLSVEQQPTTGDLSSSGYTNFARKDARIDAPGALVGQQPTLVLSNSATGFTGGLLVRYQAAVTANQTYDAIKTHDQEVVLAPGDALQLSSNVANTLVFFNAMWRERFLDDGERQV